MDEREIWLRLACIRRLSAHHAVSAATILTETCTQKTVRSAASYISADLHWYSVSNS